MRTARLRHGLLLLFIGPSACGSGRESQPSCPAEPVSEIRAPDVELADTQIETWIAGAGNPTQVLLDDDAKRALLEANVRTPEAWRDPFVDSEIDAGRLAAHFSDRSSWLQKRVTSGDFEEASPGALERAISRIQETAPVDEFHAITEFTTLHCLPMIETLHNREATDAAFDRNRCSGLAIGEVVRAARRSMDGAWWFVHAGHSLGWVHAPAWTAPLPRAEALDFRDRQPRVHVLADGTSTHGGRILSLGSSFPLVATATDSWRVLVPAADGLVEDTIQQTTGVHLGPMAFTRLNLWSLALGLLDYPYGWGEAGGGRDCSRFVLDVWSAFGLKMARHSAIQARLGGETIEVGALEPEAKRDAIRAASQRGVLLLHMPGHIMLYLGSKGDRDYAISAISEYLTPCEGGPDTVHRLDRVAVTTLNLGAGSSRGSFLERITQVAVFGPPGAQ